MIGPSLLAQVGEAAANAGPDGYEVTLGAGFLAIVSVLAWLIGVVRGNEKYQALKEKYDTARSVVGDYVDMAQAARLMDDKELAKVAASKGMELMSKK